MERVLSNTQMRAADAYTVKVKGQSAQTLMARAGAAIADEVEKIMKKHGFKSAVVVCGSGNNGGDGYVCAESLKNRGIAVSVYAVAEPTSEECILARKACTAEFTHEINADLIVDCIFGTGLCRDIGGKFAEAVNAVNASGAYVVSADIPSGLNGDNGLIQGCAVKADLTVVIAEYKLGHFLNDGLDLCGKTVKKDIGIICPQTTYAEIYSDEDIKPFFIGRKRNSHKGTYGSANIVAGSSEYLGAAALACSAALKSGCGYVRLTTAEMVKLSLVPVYPQVIFSDGIDFNSHSIAIGMGCGVSKDLYNKIIYILENYEGALIIDADGLNALSEYGTDILLNKKCKVILTPHVKEFSRLTGAEVGTILSDPVGMAQSFAKKFGVTMLLKGAASIICDGERTAVNVRGTSALAKGGSGDMLSGYMCGLLARGLSTYDAAVCAAYVLGLSAEISSAEKTDYCVTAEDVIKNLHFAVRRLTNKI